MSLRTKSLSDGYGPTVSLGETTHAAEPTAGVVGVVIPTSVKVVGDVGLSPPQATVRTAPVAPSMPSAFRRLTCLFVDSISLSFREASRDPRVRTAAAAGKIG